MKTYVKGFQRARLKQLRAAHSLTLIELGKRVGLPSSILKNWENGTQLPDTESLGLLCRTFGVSRLWFLKRAPIALENPRPYFFRNEAAAYKQVRERSKMYLTWLQEISNFFQDAMDWPTLNIPMLETDDCRLISDDDIEDMALLCRERWSLGTSPVPDVLQVMENAGIICSRATLGDVKLNGVSHVSMMDGRPYVLIAEDKANAIRNRLDAAHELGHIVLHSQISERKYTKGTYHKRLEEQAHRFARAFLLPSEKFSQEVAWPTLDNLISLKPRWKVSVAAMIARCSDLSLVNESLELRLWKGRASRKWSRSEPGDDAVEFERPKLMMRGVHLLLENAVFDRDALVSQIGLSPEMIEMLCNLPEGFFAAQPSTEDRVVPIGLKQNQKNTKRAESKSAEILLFRN
ncbi:helix-turn-helix domain-containing protein [Microbulbifer epialgicus]|uniref:Helix-turn-helix domain-containing protein n=1 Tax=Microbulbifer epialgicus TaxID=393907 RepID=A0ABV4NVC8_9GAMM